MTIIIEYTWICLNVPYKTGSEYTSGPKYTRIVNMGEFSMRALHSVLNIPEYALTEFFARILNMAEFWILAQVSKYVSISLNMS